MSEAGRVWQLFRGDELLAELIVTGGISRGLTPRSGQRPGSQKSGRCSMRNFGGWTSWMRSLSNVRPHIAASAR
jgi:hypothetical protein